MLKSQGSNKINESCSSMKDTNTWLIFFRKMKELGDINVIKPKVFTSDDDDDSFYNAWKPVMGEVPNRLLCIWQTDRNWRENLHIKTSNIEKRALVYKALRILLQTTKIQEFQTLLKGFTEMVMADDETRSFGQYFQKEYVARQTVWAYCFWKNCEINTNMKLESLHKILKYFYLYRKKIINVWISVSMRL